MNRTFFRTLPAVLAVSTMTFTGASTAEAAAPPPSAVSAASTRDTADDIMNMPYLTFMRYKDDTGSRAPQFDWRDNGCSGPWGVRRIYSNLFARPCQQHDFGYRNYGSDSGGLALAADGATRAWIDRRLYTEMRRVCRTQFNRWYESVNRYTCEDQALRIFLAVRAGGHSSYF